MSNEEEGRNGFDLNTNGLDTVERHMGTLRVFRLTGCRRPTQLPKFRDWT